MPSFQLSQESGWSEWKNGQGMGLVLDSALTAFPSLQIANQFTSPSLELSD